MLNYSATDQTTSVRAAGGRHFNSNDEKCTAENNTLYFSLFTTEILSFFVILLYLFYQNALHCWELTSLIGTCKLWCSYIRIVSVLTFCLRIYAKEMR